MLTDSLKLDLNHLRGEALAAHAALDAQLVEVAGVDVPGARGHGLAGGQVVGELQLGRLDAGEVDGACV